MEVEGGERGGWRGDEPGVKWTRVMRSIAGERQLCSSERAKLTLAQDHLGPTVFRAPITLRVRGADNIEGEQRLYMWVHLVDLAPDTDATTSEARLAGSAAWSRRGQHALIHVHFAARAEHESVSKSTEVRADNEAAGL
jgi:hypothetical protein